MESRVATLQSSKEAAWNAVGKRKPGYRKQTKIWTCKDGTKLRICDMSDFHLKNSISMLERIAEHLRQVNLTAAWQMEGMLQGEMALYYIDQDIFRLSNPDSNEDFLPEIYWNLINEKESRNL